MRSLFNNLSNAKLSLEKAVQSGIRQSQFLEYLDLIGDGIKGLEEWEKSLAAAIEGKNVDACIVMNANPLTVGHRYLVELASRRSSGLLVLVIQGSPESGGKGNHENTGIKFPFQVRLEMARTCLSEIPGVVVLPSGPYIISRDDYPKHFLSDEMGPASAHAVLDSMVFCHVLNSLGIDKAFAGDEPRDELSEIHLNALRIECRDRGIALKVAERKRLGERYISSALARQAMADKDMEMLRAIVPKSVIDLALSESFRKGPCF